MKYEEMREIADRADDIARALTALETSENELRLINKLGPDKTWRVAIGLTQGDSYHKGKEVAVDLHFGVVQQQAVNKVNALRRRIVQLGGECPSWKQ